MLEKPRISEQSLTDCLQANYGIHAVSITFLPLGADMHSAVYKVETKGTPCFVKLRLANNQNISVDILELLHQQGIQQIIAPVKTIHGKSSQPVNDDTLTVFPFIHGKNGFQQSLSDDQWILLGKALRQVHETTVPTSLQNQIRRETYSPKWRQIVRSIYPALESKPLNDEYAVKLHAFMNQNIVTIQKLVNQAENLALQVQQETPQFVLCHSDIHAGNVLMTDSSIYIVDWDEPIMAARERDLMFIGAGVGNVWNKPREIELFYEGYGKIEINRKLLAYYRHERIAEDIAVYARQLLLTTSGGLDRHENYKHFIAMFDPVGVVDCALNYKLSSFL